MIKTKQKNLDVYYEKPVATTKLKTFFKSTTQNLNFSVIKILYQAV